VLVAARDEGERIGATVAALRAALPGARVWVADDGSCDATAHLAEAAGARVAAAGAGGRRSRGKGAAMTGLARRALAEDRAGEAVFVLCDGDLGHSARELGALAGAVERGEGDVAVAVFARSAGGGLGIVRRYAAHALKRSCGVRLRAPLCGQRAMRAATLERLLPFAGGYGMELAMTIDAVRGGLSVVEVELDLEHRVTGRTPAGFAHRARQLADLVRASRARRE
jgi:glycosyltransferase involved in cell wall biosynthesis